MRYAILGFLLSVLGAAPVAAQIPPEWQAAAQAVIGELERDTPRAAKPWGPELTQGWNLARAWRKHNNGNIEIILAEYLTFTALCRRGCSGSTIKGQGYVAVAEQAKALRNQNGGAYAMASNAHAWLAGLPDPSGAAQKNAALWAKDLDVASADFATSNIYALAWLLARNRATPAEQADAFARFAIFVQGKAWIGAHCLDISKVATVLDAPPRIDACK
ncbi:MAG: hypothetical protein A3D94_11380 [Alphaproteobacteria bacterium RIFCSPHIGHO2_12_FULL_66_14]|jgi:hypothetical protein|nr:MAG: hypothetical protein A3D94_11380 [Alphaproteobacteria bacterium RIFCSPHIGHO2_12_FULL_66_14]